MGPSIALNIFGGVVRPFSPCRTSSRLTKHSAKLRSPMGDGEGRVFSHQNSGETPAQITGLPSAPFEFQPEQQTPILEDIELFDTATT